MGLPPLQSRRGLFHNGFEQFMSGIADLVDIKEPLAFLGLDRSYARLKREAMATDFEIIYCAYEKPETRAVGMKMLDEVDRIESIFNIWQGECELQKVNQRAAIEPVHVSKEVYNLVKIAQLYYKRTEGAYDITCTPLTRRWGFFQRQGRLPSPDELAEARNKTGMDFVELNNTEHTIFFKREGIELTPASIGKGFALDCALRIARQRGLKNVLTRGGFSSVCASGAPAWKTVWEINIRNPLDSSKPLAKIGLCDQGFSSSGDQLQHFVHEGKKYGHIIDPRTGWPAGHLSLVNVIAPTALKRKRSPQRST